MADAFSLPGPYQQQYNEIARRQKMAEMLQAQAFAPDTAAPSYNGIPVPVSAFSGLSKALAGIGGGYLQNKAIEEQKKLGEDAQTETKEFVAGLQGTPRAATQPTIEDPEATGALPFDRGATFNANNTMTVPGIPAGVTPLSQADRTARLLAGMTSEVPNIRSLAPVLYASDEAKARAAEALAGKREDAEKARVDALALKAAPGDRAPPAIPSILQEYEFAKKQGFTGSFIDFATGLRKAGATNVTVGGESKPDSVTRTKLSEAEGKSWLELLDAGKIAGNMSRDLEGLDEVMKLAPQSAITGRLATAFPGFSTAGDVFQSIVKRIAPTLRAPGSGSTSDIDYEGFLQSLPQLRLQPGSNEAIVQIMKQKAALDIERAGIVVSYQNEEIDAKTARIKLREINSRSILTPEMRAAIAKLNKPKSGSPAPGQPPLPPGFEVQP